MNRIFLGVFLCLGSLALQAGWTSQITPISEETAERMKQHNVFVDYEQAPVKPDRLRTVHFTHWDFDGKEQTGKMVVLDVVAKHVVEIFKEIYDCKFPIQKCMPMEEYEGSDISSMEDNNSSAFNSRPVTGKIDVWSIHAYGLALDINPRQNPYLGESENEPNRAILLPSKSFEYINRDPIKPGMVEPIVPIFKKHGFNIWGGKWHTPIDNHHFQPPTDFARALGSLTYEEGVRAFEGHVRKVKEDDREA